MSRMTSRRQTNYGRGITRRFLKAPFIGCAESPVEAISDLKIKYDEWLLSFHSSFYLVDITHIKTVIALLLAVVP